MLSAVISSILSYPALQLALQPVHQWYVQPGPLVLGSTPLNSSTRIADRDRTVSRRSEPSSHCHFNWRTAKPLGPAPAPGCDEPRRRVPRHCRRCGRLLGDVSLCLPGMPPPSRQAMTFRSGTGSWKMKNSIS